LHQAEDSIAVGSCTAALHLILHAASDRVMRSLCHP
jgi:hypothetical protein